ncbi:MAG: hypothetical protein FJ246_00965 [Nitrospira sp.]|nr:hypothetical protein [Nitrospira sp.]
MIKAVLPCLLLLCLGCAGPTFATRAVHSDPSWLVRLDSHADPDPAASLRYDHPADWSELELREILNRLLVQERVGALEQKPAPQPVFTADEAGSLAPRLRQAFQMARPSEWIVFVVTRSAGTGQEITSGGFFIADRRLHVLLANHREAVSPEESRAVKANPVSAVKKRGQSLTFDPARFALETQTSWLGGYSGLAASEMILDQTGFLEAARRPAIPLAPALAPAPVTAPVTAPVAAQPSVRPAVPAASMQPPAPAQAKPSDAADGGMQNQMQKLQEEIERLKQTLAEQSTELSRLKSQSVERKPSKKKPATKKPEQ